jgi:hypothetical protein
MLHQDNETLILNHSEMSDQDLEELFAMKALLVNPNGILQSVPGFEKFCFAVNGFIPNPETVDIPNVLMIAHAVDKAEKALNRKLLFTEPADHTVIVYIAHILYDEGWIIAPKILHFAQVQLDKLTSDYGKELFKDVTNDQLLKFTDFNEDDAMSNQALKLKTLNEYLSLMGE